MAQILHMKLNTQSIDKAIAKIQDYRKSVQEKVNELCRRLAEMGATSVSIGYARAIYSGKKDISVSVEKISDGYSIVAEGESVMFVEFGTGVTYGNGHPQAGELGMGPGTYPDGKGHWDDPDGWWIPRENGGGHTYGNPPSMTMYRTARELQDVVLHVAREVFTAD